LPDLSITDSLGNPLDISTVKWTSGSSLYNYGKSELFHLAVAPDFVSIKDKTLTQGAPKPLSFKLSLQHAFQLGGSTPEIDVTPGGEVDFFVNATPGSSLFDDDNFHLPVTVPAQTGYVGMSFHGSLDLGVSGSSGNLSFGIDSNRAIALEFVKAFQTDPNEPTVWDAAAAVLSNFVIPASIEDLKRLHANDVCTVSGAGSLKVSGSVTVSVPVNPLASVNLPLGVGTLAVSDGALAGLSASLTLSGSYQIRVERLTSATVRLSYLRDRGSELTTDLTVSAGVSVDLNTTDLLARLLGTISTGKVDQKLLDGLTADDVTTFNAMLKAGVDHALQASVDLALSTSTDNEAAFQYEIQPDLLDAASTDAVNRALKGDLTLLTALEERATADGTLAKGVKLLNSVFSTAKNRGFSLKVNLIGIVNLISSSNLISKCEFLFEPASGDLTIKETAESDRISAITDPYKLQAALCKAMFDSVLATTTYVVSKAVTMPALSCETVHFATNQNTSNQTLADYTNWLVVLNLLKKDERSDLLRHTSRGGTSTCVVRATLDDAGCEALFFDGEGNVRDKSQYLEIGRQALRALLDPADSPVDQFRYKVLDNDVTWQKALAIGPSPELSSLIPLQSTDPRLNVVVNDVSGDLYDIVWWSESMQTAGQALHDMRVFLSGREPATLAGDPAFAARRDALQKLILAVVGKSKVRFNEPWGMVCLYWAAGSRESSGKLTAPGLTLDRRRSAQTLAAAGKA
jgi:hypothetical protein